MFVGEVPNSTYGRTVRATASDARARGRIRFTGRVDTATYRRWLAAADMAVQLRTHSRGETSAAVLDCMAHGIPTLVNAHGSMAELPPEACASIADTFTVPVLRRALVQLRRSETKRARMGALAAAHLRTVHDPRHGANLYAAAIERHAAEAGRRAGGLLARTAPFGPPADGPEQSLFIERARAVAPVRGPSGRQILVDVSDMVRHDQRTGIQRVTRSLLHELLAAPPPSVRVEPVYAGADHGFRYARQFTARFLGLPAGTLHDDPVELAANDVLLLLDWHPEMTIRHQRWLQEIRARGVRTVFMVYDLLPALRPEFFPDYMRPIETEWLGLVARADGAVCISRTVAGTLRQWLDLFGPARATPLMLGWSPLGADGVRAVDGIEIAAPALIAQLGGRPTFLMVGTIEPRKGYQQALAAFELLSRRGTDANLIIVGKPGFRADLEDALRRHPETGRRLLWLQGLGDAGLEQLYAASDCLIAASHDEGFGLPLIEAARYGKPVIARDIPVFREVAGAQTLFFAGDGPHALAGVVADWLWRGTAPPDAATWLTWQESARRLLELVLDWHWPERWVPGSDAGLVGRFWGTDHRFGTAVGERRGTALHTTGAAGHLFVRALYHAAAGRVPRADPRPGGCWRAG